MYDGWNKGSWKLRKEGWVDEMRGGKDRLFD